MDFFRRAARTYRLLTIRKNVIGEKVEAIKTVLERM
jgi:hypothetical protein